MRYHADENHAVIRIDRGEEVIAALLEVIARFPGRFGRVTAVGACDDVTIAAYDTVEKVYSRTTVQEPLELTTLTGNVGFKDGEPYNHIHATFGRHDGSVFGGHLDRAVVSGTTEAIVDFVGFPVDRHYDDDSGLNLLSL